MAGWICLSRTSTDRKDARSHLKQMAGTELPARIFMQSRAVWDSPPDEGRSSTGGKRRGDDPSDKIGLQKTAESSSDTGRRARRFAR